MAIDFSHTELRVLNAAGDIVKTINLPISPQINWWAYITKHTFLPEPDSDSEDFWWTPANLDDYDFDKRAHALWSDCESTAESLLEIENLALAHGFVVSINNSRFRGFCLDALEDLEDLDDAAKALAEMERESGELDLANGHEKMAEIASSLVAIFLDLTKCWQGQINKQGDQ
jgi:hypothetical protein